MKHQFGPTQYRAMGVLIAICILLGVGALISQAFAPKPVAKAAATATPTPTATVVSDEESDVELLSSLQTKLNKSQSILTAVNAATDAQDEKTFCKLLPQLNDSKDDFDEEMVKVYARPSLKEMTKKLAPYMVNLQNALDTMNENAKVLCS